MTASPLLPSISVVVPVYNSDDSLDELVGRLHVVLAAAASEYEVVLVNDGSTDKSWAVIEDLADNEAVRGIDLGRNYGQHNALLCGIRQAQHELIVTIDDDLQIPPEEIPVLVGALGDDVDVVYGTPDKTHYGLLRGMATRVTKLVLQKSMGEAVASKISAFRVFRTSLRSGFDRYQAPHVSIDVLLTWATTRFTTVTTRFEPRAQGESGYTIRKLAAHTFNLVTGFSTVPLQVASLIGLFFTLVGIGLLAYVLVQFFVSGSEVPGFTFLATSIALFSGAQLLALGIIGEYLARVHFRTMDRPPYHIRSSTDG